MATKKDFGLSGALATPRKTGQLQPSRAAEVINLERVDLQDKGNWLRALEACKPNSYLTLEEILEQVTAYQRHIDHSLQTAQAQSTIYAYAIGKRLDLVEADKLYLEKGYSNITKFVDGGELRRQTGEAITSRQIWSYRRVTRGLDDFFSLIEQMRQGIVPPEIEAELAKLGNELQKTTVESFLTSYAENLAGLLELGVSKIEQLCRLPQSKSMAGLLAGQISIEDVLIPVKDVSFAELRRAIASCNSETKKTASSPKTQSRRRISQKVSQLEKLVKEVLAQELNAADRAAIAKLRSLLDQIN